MTGRQRKASGFPVSGFGGIVATVPGTDLFGHTLLDVVAAIWTARALRGTAVIIEPRTPVNTALHSLCSPKVKIINVRGWRAGLTRAALARMLPPHGPENRRGMPGLGLRPQLCTPVPVRLRPDVERRTAALAEEVGIDSDRPMVTVHVRDPGWRRTRPKPSAKEARRNASIHNYIPAMDHLISRGFTVVRVGTVESTPIDHPGVIDLAHSRHRTDELEFWCLARSAFIVAGDSSSMPYAWLVGVPSLLVNATDPFNCYPLRPRDRYILKSLVHRETLRSVPFAEWISPAFPRRWSVVLEQFDLLECTSDEVLAAVVEMEQELGAQSAPTRAQLEYRRHIAAVCSDPDVQKHLSKGPYGWYIGGGLISRSFIEARGLGM